MLPNWESAKLNLYSSADLLTWTHVGHIFSVDDLPAPYTSMERPKVCIGLHPCIPSLIQSATYKKQGKLCIYLQTATYNKQVMFSVNMQGL
jgi:hypothetical protein